MTTLRCPVLDCDWTEDVPGPDPRATHPETLAEVFGHGVLAAATNATHSANIERSLEAHFAGHILADYVRTMEAQRGALAVLEGRLVPAAHDAELFRMALVQIAEALQLDAPPADTNPPAGAAELSTWTSRAVAEIMRRDHRPRPNRTVDKAADLTARYP